MYLWHVSSSADKYKDGHEGGTCFAEQQPGGAQQKFLVT